MRVVVVTNPRSTAASTAARRAVEDGLRSLGSVTILETTRRGHATDLARQAMLDGAQAVLAMGGDGTVNEVVNGLLCDGVHAAVPPLGVVPVGSTNVFARAIGLPNDAAAAVAVLRDRLLTGVRRHITVGRADGRWFLFSAGLGFDAAVTAEVERARSRGTTATHALYVRTALKQYGRTLRAAPAITMTRPDGTSVDGLHLVIVSNTNPWTYLGERPVTPTPLTTLENGLGVYARERIGPASMVRGLADILATERVPAGRGVLVEHDVSALELHTRRPLPFELDGDYLGERTDVHLQAVPKALAVLC